MTDEDVLRRRLERERRARREAEEIAERVTAELYASQGELRLANQELQGLNQSLRDFVAIASHDLRGPLTAIIGFASMMKRGDAATADRRAEFVGVIERNARHLSKLVDELLTVSKIEAGALDIHAEVVALRDAIHHVIADYSARAGEIRVNVVDARALVDPHHLRRILTNYVGNALKYGQPPVAVEATETDGWVDVRVRDAGEGVPDELVPRLFQKFARGRNSQGGTGLGLSIVRGLAQANGGDAWYEANQPHGSCFAVRLPRISA